MSGLFKGTHASVSCRPTSASGGGGARGSPAASLAARCYALSSCPSVPPRVCTPRFALGAQITYLPPNWLPHFSPPSFTFRLPKCLISSSVECGSFREKSEGIINQGSHRRRHVTLGRGPACHQPVQTRHCRSKGICTLMCFFRVAVSSKFMSHWMQGGDFLSLASLQLINPDEIFCSSKP